MPAGGIASVTAGLAPSPSARPVATGRMPVGAPLAATRRTAMERPMTLDPDTSREAAAEAGLRWSTDARPGIARRRAGRGFSYRAADGSTIRDSAVIARIRALAIPPAWTDVWICPDPRGHLQATGRDARGRKQHRYHAAYREHRDGAKFDRMIAFAGLLPTIRERVDADLGRPGLPREKVLAAVVRLLELTLIRVGNEEYARLNKSFGLTTLRDRHARIDGSTDPVPVHRQERQAARGHAPRPPARAGRRALPGAARPGPPPVRGRGRRGAGRPLRGRQRLPARGGRWRRRDRQGLPHLGRHGA